MVPRLQYIESIINQFYKHTPTIFHKQIRRVLYEHYAPIINNMKITRLNSQMDSLCACTKQTCSLHKRLWGGKRNEASLIQTYKGYKFKINVQKTKYDTLLSIVTHDKGNPLQCAIINIDRDTHIAYLNNISYHKDCAIPALLKSGGSIILNFILGFLKKNKKGFGINRIALKDNSIKACKGCNINIQLSGMYMLLHGNTWYGKYGFRPFNMESMKPDKTYAKLYKRNQIIIAKAKVKDVPLLRYIAETVKKHNIKRMDLKWIGHVLTKWQNKSLSQVLRAIMKDYNLHCCVFAHIQPRIINRLGLTRFHNTNFYLDI